MCGSIDIAFQYGARQYENLDCEKKFVSQSILNDSKAKL